MLYAVVSYQRIDGATRARPRIYPESLANTAYGAWFALFKTRAWPDRLAGPGRTFSHQIAAVKKRLDAVAMPVAWAVGSTQSPRLILNAPPPDETPNRAPRKTIAAGYQREP